MATEDRPRTGRITMREALDRLPKVELHCHIEGTMRPHTVAELARKNGHPFPVEDPTDLYRYTSLDSFLSVFWLVQECLADRGDWARLAYESVVDGAAHGLIYRESFFTPARHLAAGQDLGEIVAGIEEGLEAAERDTGARVLLIADIDKAHGPSAGLEMIERLVELRSNGLASRVIGMGMDSTELGVDPLQFRDAYRLGERSGLRLTGHQGETSPPSTIRDVVEDLHCERVDHGLSILADPDVVGRVRDRGVPLTVCPISNVKIANAVARLEDHPWPRMRAAGLHVTLNTDDPAMIDDDLGLEYAAVAEAFGYSFDDMVATSVAGVDATWLTDQEKSSLRGRVTGAAEDLRSLLDPAD